MEGCDTDVIARIAETPRAQVPRILKFESGQLEVTKSLLNLLFNAVIVGSLPVSLTQKVYFDNNANLVHQLVGTSKSLTWKKKELTENSSLAINIASLCPSHTVAGSSSRKTAIKSSRKRKRTKNSPLHKRLKKVHL